MYLIAVYLSIMNCLKGVSRVTAHFYINEHRRGSLRVENEHGSGAEGYLWIEG